ncbi:MAG: CBS domain-containing protein [Pirellulales bacterium]|nr:CBS domain-containing protein [Pirellulales bacterium]
MYTAKDIMNPNVITIDPDDTIEVAISLMSERGVSGLPVVDMSGHLVGILTEFDLLDLFWDPTTARNEVYHYMTRDIRKVEETDEVSAVAELFRMLAVRRILVVRSEELVGVISRRDLLRHVQRVRQKSSQTTQQTC